MGVFDLLRYTKLNNMRKDRKEYMLAYQREWIKKRRASFLQAKSCAVCGSIKRLEVDHRDPSKKEHEVRNLWSRKAMIRDKELGKCQVLCNACHKEKTKQDYIERRRPLVHGTEHGYDVWRCKCRECKAAHSKGTTRRRLKTAIKR